MNPTEQFRESVESALDGAFTAYGKGAAGLQAEALASIQASTVELFTRLVGEDDDVTDLKNFNSKAEHRNALRQELRQKIDQLIKDLSK